MLVGFEPCGYSTYGEAPQHEDGPVTSWYAPWSTGDQPCAREGAVKAHGRVAEEEARHATRSPILQSWLAWLLPTLVGVLCLVASLGVDRIGLSITAVGWRSAGPTRTR